MKKLVNIVLEQETLDTISDKLDNLQYATRSEFIRKAIYNELERSNKHVEERSTKD